MKNEFITLSDLLGVLKNRLIPIFLAALLCGALTYGATCLMPKKYSATSSFYVRNMPTGDYTDRYGVTSSQTAAAQTMAQDFAGIIPRSDLLLERAINNHGLGCTTGKLRGMLETEADSKSAVFYVKVTCEDKEFALRAARAIEAELPAVITELAWDVSTIEDDFTSVTVLQKAGGARQSAPRYKLLTAMGAAVGALVTYIVFLLVFLFGTAVRTEEDVARALPDYPILGRIPHWGGPDIKQKEEE